MKRSQLSRRTLLRGAAGGTTVALALPLLEAMLNRNGTALANGAPLPRRMITRCVTAPLVGESTTSPGSK